MNPTLIIQLVMAVMASTPEILAGAVKAKALVDALFTSALINKYQQDALMAHVDSLARLAQVGIVPPHWQVEPDPA